MQFSFRSVYTVRFLWLGISGQIHDQNTSDRWQEFIYNEIMKNNQHEREEFAAVAGTIAAVL